LQRFGHPQGGLFASPEPSRVHLGLLWASQRQGRQLYLHGVLFNFAWVLSSFARVLCNFVWFLLNCAGILLNFAGVLLNFARVPVSWAFLCFLVGLRLNCNSTDSVRGYLFAFSEPSWVRLVLLRASQGPGRHVTTLNFLGVLFNFVWVLSNFAGVPVVFVESYLTSRGSHVT
jgi:hypothetical protein